MRQNEKDIATINEEINTEREERKTADKELGNDILTKVPINVKNSQISILGELKNGGVTLSKSFNSFDALIFTSNNNSGGQTCVFRILPVWLFNFLLDRKEGEVFIMTTDSTYILIDTDKTKDTYIQIGGNMRTPLKVYGIKYAE